MHFSWLFDSKFYTHHLWSFELDQYLWLHSNSHNSKFRWVTTWLRWLVYLWGWAFDVYMHLWQTMHFWWLFDSKFYTHHLWSFKLDQYLWLDSNSHNSKFRWVATWLRWLVYLWGEHLTYTCINGKQCTFGGFLSQNSTHIISGALNLISTYDLIVIVTILSFTDWGCGWGDLCTCEGEHIWRVHTFMADNALFVAFWLKILHIFLKLQTWLVPLTWF